MLVVKTFGKMGKYNTVLQKVGYQPPHPGPDGRLRDRRQIGKLYASSTPSRRFEIRREPTHVSAGGSTRGTAAVPIDP